MALSAPPLRSDYDLRYATAKACRRPPGRREPPKEAQPHTVRAGFSTAFKVGCDLRRELGRLTPSVLPLELARPPKSAKGPTNSQRTAKPRQPRRVSITFWVATTS